MHNFGWGDLEASRSDMESDNMQCDNIFGVYPFFIEKGNTVMNDSDILKELFLVENNGDRICVAYPARSNFGSEFCFLCKFLFYVCMSFSIGVYRF